MTHLQVSQGWFIPRLSAQSKEDVTTHRVHALID